jgi:hypothetical protein
LNDFAPQSQIRILKQSVKLTQRPNTRVGFEQLRAPQLDLPEVTMRGI